MVLVPDTLYVFIYCSDNGYPIYVSIPTFSIYKGGLSFLSPFSNGVVCVFIS